MVSTRSQRSGGEAGGGADTAATSSQPRASTRSKKQQPQQAPISEADEDYDQTAKAAGAHQSQAQSDSPFREREIKLLSPRSGGRSVASPPKPVQAADLASVPLPEDDAEEEDHARPHGMDVPPPASDQKKQRRVASGRTASSSSANPSRRSLVSWLATCMVLMVGVLFFAMHSPSLTPHLPPQLRSGAYPACTATRAHLQQARVQLERALAQVQPTAQHAQQQAGRAYTLMTASVQQHAALARVTLSKLAAQASSLMEQAKAQATELLARLAADPAAASDAAPPSSSPPSVPLGSEAVWALLEGLVTPSGHHDSDAFAATAARSQQQHKALGVLLSCPSEASCAAAVQHIASFSSSSIPASCVAVLSAAHYSDAGSEAAGRLQHRLATALLPCLQAASPAVVVFQGLELAQPSVLGVLNNALSESGNLQLNGAAVPTASATFVFPVALSPPGEGSEQLLAAAGSAEGGEAEAPGSGSYEAFARHAKDALQLRQLRAAALADQEAGVEPSEGSGDAAAGLVRALRRRLDLVLPVQGAREGGAASAQEQAAEEVGEV